MSRELQLLKQQRDDLTKITAELEQQEQPKTEKQARINQLVNELYELTKEDQDAQFYLDDVVFEVFGYD